MQLPEPYELIAFFEAEPTFQDPQQPWTYNTVTFWATLSVPEDQFKFELSPSYGHVKMFWRYGEAHRLALDLNQVENIRVDEDGRSLVVEFSQSLPLGHLRLRLRPVVYLSWSVGP